MSKYDVGTLLSSGSVGRLKRSTETDPLEREERAILCEHIRGFFFIEMLAIYLKTCMICA